MALNACLQVTPLWSLCGVTCTRVPRTQHLSFAVCVHTQFRWGSTPPREGCQVLLLSLCLSVSLVCCPVCVLRHCQVPGHGRHTTKMAIMRSAHLPPQGEGGRVGCAGACAHASAHVRPEENVGRLRLSLSKLSLETGSLPEPRAPKSSRLLRSVWLCPDGVMRE